MTSCYFKRNVSQKHVFTGLIVFLLTTLAITVFVFESEIKTTFQIKTTVKVVANQQTMPLHIAEEKITLTDAFRREMEWAVKPGKLICYYVPTC